MRHSDPTYDPDDEYKYECLNCSTVVENDTHPGNCPDCGAEMRNRRMPFE